MASIHLTTEIHAPIERVFDLSRSIDFHRFSVQHTQEEAIAGRTVGLINLGETVTWRARHMGFFHKMTVSINAADPPFSFTDEMVKGPFTSMEHTHRFQTHGTKTIMSDDFEFHTPFGYLGRLINFLFLRSYMQQLLRTRNRILKQVAESDEWKSILP
jgi:ligand-binding SRPBCC domain-containing protein